VIGPVGAGRWLYGQAYLLLTLTTLIWGAHAVVGRLAVGHVSPMATTCLRWLLVVVLLAVGARRQIIHDWPVLLRHWRFLLLMGALGFTGFNALFYAAAHHTTAVNLGLIQGIVPGIVLLGSLFMYGTPIGRLQVVGLIVAALGVAVAVTRGDLDALRHLDLNIGDVWMVAASILYAGYTVALRRRPAVAPLSAFAGMAAGAFLSSLPLLGWEIAAGAVLWPDARGWALLLFIAIMPSLVSQITFMRSVELIGPGRAGQFVNLVPIFAALLGVVILGEAFALYHAVALALVLGGIGLAEQSKPAT
jgi:drug/metabolite transporter (DMT)-like permease